MENPEDINQALTHNELLNSILLHSGNQSANLQKEFLYNLHNKPILTGEELMILPEMEDNYLIENFLWEGDVALLLAREKVGKSILAMQMACALTCGGSFLGEYDVLEPMKVLYIQAEGHRQDTIMRLRKMTSANGFKWRPENFYHMFPSALSLDTEDGYNDIVKKINDTNFRPRVIFTDPLYMGMEGDLIDNRASRRFCRNIRRLQEHFKSTNVIVHHENRGTKDEKGNMKEMGDNSIFGSFVWKAFPSHVIRLKTLHSGQRILSCETQRGGNIVKDMKLDLLSPEPLMFKIHGTKDHAPYIDKVFEYINSFGKENGVYSQQVVTGAQLSDSAVRNSFRYLLENNMIYKVNPGKCPVYYKAINKGGQL